MVHYLEPEELLVIHARIIDETGGTHGVRDTKQLSSIPERPKMQFGGKELYGTVFEKAAAYFHSTARHHVFVDGNKRTAIALAVRFLYLNGYTLEVSNKEMEEFVVKSVVEKYDILPIAEWLKKYSKKIKTE